MERIGVSIRIFLGAFLIPWLAMATFFAMTETRPPKIEVPILKRAMVLKPIWHNLPTAYRNQHRLFAAGIFTGGFLAALSFLIDPERKRLVAAFSYIAVIPVAFAANLLDCSWHFRFNQDMIMVVASIRALPWIAVGALSMWCLAHVHRH